jgi:DNA-binding CsgD family transcriptional regulator
MGAGDHEVWARMAWVVVSLASEIEYPIADLLAGLPFDEVTLRRRKRVAWDDYATMFERLGDAAGGFAELEDLGAGSYHKVVPEVRAVAGSLVSPTALLRFIIDVLDPLVFPPVAFEMETFGEGRARVSLFLRPGVRPCEAYVVGSCGALRGLTMHLGLPPIEILSRDIQPDRGIFDVQLPEARTIVTRLRRFVMRFVIGAEADGTPIHASVGSPDTDPMSQRLAQATVSWKLTPREVDVLELVATGKSNKEVAQALACADNTVERHVTRMLRKAKFTSRSELIAAFWSREEGFPP